MLYVINYANGKFKNSQKLNTKTALKVGKADKVINYSSEDIDEKFYNNNIKILSQKRGNGYWLWKPYFIYKTLNEINFGDYLMYCDSGAYFVDDIHKLINVMNKDKQDIMCFQIETVEKNYSKRDAFILMNCDNNVVKNSKQVCATFSLYKKSAKSLKLVKDWLKYCQDERIITDIPNKCGRKNYPGFIDNRHDQTAFSLICKKYNLNPYRDISQYGKNIVMTNSDFPQIVECHRIPIAKTKFEVIILRILIPILLPLYKKIIKK